MIARRAFVLGLSMSVLAAPLASSAQPQRTVPRIGILVAETLSVAAAQIESFRAGLVDYGYVEGKSIAIEIRSAGGDFERLPKLAAELAGLKVDVVVAFGARAALAARRATATIPIVDPVMGDPVATRRGSGLARAGGNNIGSVQLSAEATAKRLELLKEVAPRIARVAFLFNPANPSGRQAFEASRATAVRLKLELQAFEVRSAKEIEATFSAMALGRVDAIVVSTDTHFHAYAIDIADLAAKQRIPSAGAVAYAVVGGLIGYGVNDTEIYRHAAYFVDRILKGTKPGDPPIERATGLDFVINLETAKTLGITIPQSLLARADEVLR